MQLISYMHCFGFSVQAGCSDLPSGACLSPPKYFFEILVGFSAVNVVFAPRFQMRVM